MTIMMSLAKKTALVALAIVGGVLTPAEASADYVCWVSHRPGSSNFGSEGHVYYTVWASPGCTGSYVGAYYLCTTGATNTGCVASAA
jgi:hypothetical protein